MGVDFGSPFEYLSAIERHGTASNKHALCQSGVRRERAFHRVKTAAMIRRSGTGEGIIPVGNGKTFVPSLLDGRLVARERVSPRRGRQEEQVYARKPLVSGCRAWGSNPQAAFAAADFKSAAFTISPPRLCKKVGHILQLTPETSARRCLNATDIHLSVPDSSLSRPLLNGPLPGRSRSLPQD
jgi:hypothetical protein